MENQRDVCLVKYNITSNLLLSNSGLLEVIIDVTETMTFSLHAGNEAGTTPLRVPPNRGWALMPKPLGGGHTLILPGSLKRPCKPPLAF